ncbi:S-methyl-5'-thioadenosine phosphorylase [Halorussus gelatinilyticus]|uniref:Purine nucleoside phosphorylase n=1 Tax=Halorussus gelatinilyticus TaxID=2937524 RepID=A0A8U0IFG8_9EURY|nr:S-methyl-5'-thioadenosine phosphorylase [Halorussus gelatinilyticus]UPV99033.1 S-methyl-5'-thioadenosine phosphorylase [Halorussus gelatinilyticus]
MTIGFIGGSGIYEALPLEDTREEEISTPFGDPSAPVTIGELAGEEVAFLPRHGPDHQHTPTNAPYKANIHALKQVGVERVLSSNAVGSLREDLPPQTLLVPDQIFDRTKHRDSTFFGDGIVVHMPFADPYCPHMVEHLSESCETATDADSEEGGTYVCIEGPQYSTRAESEFYRDQGWDVIGMTTIPEAKLAREAEMCYATVTGVTDYDVWKEDSEVTLQEVLDNAAENEESIKEVVEHAVRNMPDERECDCGHALEGTINTPTEAIPEETRERVDAFVGEYLN